MSTKRTKTLAQADPVVRQEVKAIRRLLKRERLQGKHFIKTVAESGRRLLRLKERVGHGHWLSTLQEEFGLSIRTAENRIAVFRLKQKLPPAKFARLANLGLLELFYELGRRTVPDEVINAVIAQVEAGEKVTVKVVRGKMRIESPFYVRAKTIAPATGEAPPLLTAPPIPEPVRSNVQILSPECAPPGYELTRHRDLIFHGVRHLADSITAAGDVTHIIAADMSEAEREMLIKDLGKIKQFDEVLTQAHFTRGHSSVN